MPLTPEQTAAARQFVISRAGVLLCPVCSHQNLHLSDQLVLVAGLEPKGEQELAVNIQAGTPLVQVSCGNCANVRFFAAALMGILTPQAPPG